MPSTHPRARRRRTARRAIPALLAILATAQVAIAQDPAYVDSPAGRVLDPARADGGSIPPADPQMPRPGTGAGTGSEQAALLQMQIELTQQAMASAREQEASDAAQMQAAAAATGQPGTSPTPMQQVGSGLLQDAGGLIDSGIQRQIDGSNGSAIVAPPYPQSGLSGPGQFDPLAPPATGTW